MKQPFNLQLLLLLAFTIVGISHTELYAQCGPGSIGTSQTICSGTSAATLTELTGPSGGMMYAYQWQSSPDNAVWTDISNATSTTYSPGSVNTSTYYRRGVSGLGCTIARTTSVLVTVNQVPNFTAIPTSGLLTQYELNGNATDISGNNNTGTLQNTPTSTIDRYGVTNSAYALNGTSQFISTTTSYTNPLNFSFSIWFKTTTTTGGKLVGFGNVQTGLSGSYDRQMYMNNAGQIYFGVYTGATVTMNSTASYRDGNWHNAVATMSTTTGLKLYVDGVLAGSVPGTTTAQNYSGWWKIGYDNLNGWPSAPSSYYFNGSVDDFLLYNRELTAAEIASNYTTADPPVSTSPVCETNALNFTMNPITGASYSWSGPNSFTSTLQNPAIASATSAASGTYTVTATVPVCGTASASVAATVYSPISGNTITASQTFCGASIPATLTGSATVAGGSGTYTYQWQSSTDNVTYSNITGATSASYSPLTVSTNTYYRRNITSGGCSSSSAPVLITINAVPVFSGISTSGLITKYAFTGNATDLSGNANTGLLQNAPIATTDRFGLTNSAYQLDGSSQYITSTTTFNNPVNITVSIWFKTTTTTGGKLIGFAGNQTGVSGNYDRHMYMNNAGQILFGVYPNTVVTITSPASYNDGSWHNAVASLSSTAGVKLYVDGTLVGSVAGTTSAQNFTGYWRLGFDNLSGWTTAPSSNYFNGTIDDFLLYNRELTSAEVTTLFTNPDGAGSNSPLCAGSTLNLQATAITGATYAWSGPNSFTSTLQNPTIPAATSAATGTYNVVATVNGCASSPAYAAATIYDVIAGNTIGSAQSICVGSAPAALAGTATVSGGSGTYAYQWQSSTDNVSYSNITGATSAGYTPGTLNANIYYRRSITSGTCTNSSAGILITVNTKPSLTSLPTDGLLVKYNFNGNATDLSGNNNNGTAQNSPTSVADRLGNANSAFNFNGTNQYISTSTAYNNPNNFAVSIWFKTTSTTGGKLIGFGATQVGQSNNYDRHVYMNNGGNIIFGAYPNPIVTITSPSAYNDGAWHHVVASLSSTTGMKLFIDGNSIGTSPTTVTGENYTGYWKIGFDNIGSWPSIPTSFYFNGALDNVMIYNRELTNAEITTIYTTPDVDASNGPVCVGSAINLTAPTVSGATYAWTGPSAYTSTLQNPTLSPSTAAMAGSYAVTATVNGCASTPLYTTVSVVNGVTGNTIANAQSTCSGVAPATALSGTGTLAGGVGIFTYQWQNSLDNTTFNTISGATATSYTSPGVSLPTYYRRVVSSSACASQSASVLISITPAPAITSSPIGAEICTASTTTGSFTVAATGTGLTYQWQYNTGGGFTNLTNGTIGGITITNATTATLNVTGINTTLNGSLIRAIVSGTCAPTATSGSAALVIYGAGRWQGTTSNDWNTASNWCGGVPSATTDVSILTGTLNSPVIGSAVAVARNLSIGTGTTLTISGTNTLIVNGNWANNGTFIPNNSTVTFSTALAQTISGNTNFNNLIILNNSNVQITSGLGNTQFINGILLLSQGTLQSNGNLNINFSNGGQISPAGNGSISGTLSVNRDLSTGWHYLCSPLDNATYADFNDDLPLTTANFFTYIESDVRPHVNYGWSALMPASLALPLKQNKFAGGPAEMNGYALNFAQPSTNVDIEGTYTHKASFNTGTLSYSPSGAPDNDGWHLVGNPYPSYINWSSSAVSRTNVNPGIVFYNNTLAQNAHYIPDLGMGEEYLNGGTPYIAPMQAFYAQTNSSGASIAITTLAQTVNPALGAPYNAPSFFRVAASEVKSLKIAAGTAACLDESVVRFGSLAKDGYDEIFDMKKMGNGASCPTLYTSQDNIDYAINSLPELTGIRSVALNYMPAVAGEQTINVQRLANFTNGATVVLEDKFLNITQDLSKEPVYSFSATPADNAERFTLLFKQAKVTASDEKQTLNAGVTYTDNLLNITLPNGYENSEVSVTNLLGQEIYRAEVKVINGHINLKLNNKTSGIYVVRVVAEGKVYSEKIYIGKE